MSNDNDQVLLTRSQVRSWEDEGRKIDEEITDLQRRRDELTRRLEAVRFLFPVKPISEDKIVAAGNSAGERAEPETMVDATIRILRNSKEPIDHATIRSFLSADAKFREKLENSPNYYYTMMNRLLGRSDENKVLKIGDKFTIANIED